MLRRSNWSKIVYINQNESVKKIDINQSLFLDSERINELELLKKYIEKKSVVAISTSNLFGHVYLLDLRLSSYNFKTQQLDNHTAQITYFIEDKMQPFSTEFIKEHITVNFKKINISEKYAIYKEFE